MTTLSDAVAYMDGATALPRDNGEIAFDAPWQARAFALAVATVERLNLPWDAFRARLMAAITDDPARPYYESWAAALEDLVTSFGLTSADALERATPTERPVT